MWTLDFFHDTPYDGRKFRMLNVIDEGNPAELMTNLQRGGNEGISTYKFSACWGNLRVDYFNG
jgi:hypothetical protein